MKLIVLMQLFLITFSSYAQVSMEVEAMEDDTNENGTYTSFEKAFKNRDDVRVLTLQKDNINDFLLNTDKFKNLKELHLHFGRQHVDYRNILDIDSLVNLSIDYSYVNVPSKIYTLKKLTNLTLTHDGIQKLPGDFFLNSTIEVINLEANSIAAIIDSFAVNNSLRVLSLKANHLQKLPKGFVKLNNVVFLNVAKNGFSTFPNEILELKKLKILNVGFNAISVIPSQISKLENLEILYLTNTSIRELPSSLKRLKRLKTIFISDLGLTEKEKKKIVNRLPKNCEINWTTTDYYHEMEFTSRLK